MILPYGILSFLRILWIFAAIIVGLGFCPVMCLKYKYRHESIPKIIRVWSRQLRDFMLDLIFFPFDFVAYYCCNKQSGQENQIIWGARRAERLLYFCPPCCRDERRPGEILEEIVQFSRNSSRYGSGSRIYHGEFSGGRYAGIFF